MKKCCRGVVEPCLFWGPRDLQAHGFESCPRSECRLGFLTRGNGFLAGSSRLLVRVILYSLQQLTTVLSIVLVNSNTTGWYPLAGPRDT
ncbi:hypothetical protein E2C01_046543 [Portunus trituberculatus]|uniref:Uncharacterized protein n=1 Tax=Portunus trituberculatus TaxID=210409 RepID=A0A5B7G549_PORTR|nr:hypothetical protein [Portunus trituberculatus]